MECLQQDKMEKTVYILIILYLVSFSACKQAPEEQAADIASSFAEAFYNLDYEKALKLSTAQSATAISFFASNINQNYIEMLKNYGKAKVEVIETNIGEYGLTAKVKCKIINCMKPNFMEETAYIEKEKEETFHLIKSGKDWFVDFHR